MSLLVAASPLLKASAREQTLGRRARAQETTDFRSDPAAARLKSMRRLARSIEVSKMADELPGPPIALRPEPLLRYNDAPRGIHDATLWAWGERGRPRAVLKVEQYPAHDAARRWVFGLVSLAPNRLAVEFQDGKQWTSHRPGQELRAIVRAPEPAGSEALRLGQMRDLAHRFSASENAGPARPAPAPTHAQTPPPLHGRGFRPDRRCPLRFRLRHQSRCPLDPRGAKASGGSTPDVELRSGRLGGAEASVALDGQEVWTQPYADPPSQRETYMNRWVAASDDAP